MFWPSVVAWQDQPSGQQSLAPPAHDKRPTLSHTIAELQAGFLAQHTRASSLNLHPEALDHTDTLLGQQNSAGRGLDWWVRGSGLCGPKSCYIDLQHEALRSTC